MPNREMDMVRAAWNGLIEHNQMRKDRRVQTDQEDGGRAHGVSARRTRRMALHGALAAAGALGAACGAAGEGPEAPAASKAPVTIEEWDWHATAQAAQY